MPKRASLALLITGIALALLLNFKTPAAPMTAPAIAFGGATSGSAGSATTTVLAGTTPASSTPTASSADTTSAATTAATTSTTSATKPGTYTGTAVRTQYGTVQVKLTVAGGTITNVQALQYPSNNPHSSSISQYAVPTLIQEALQTQSAQINAVSGATYTSQGFVQSLQSALSQAGV
jgi:uncharacterized protein with FMN-binding domain